MSEGTREDGEKMAAPAAFSNPAMELERGFQEHHGRVFRAAYRVTGNASDAEDVLQTVFLRLARNGWPGASVGNIESYLHRAAVNAALDLVRGRRDSQKVALEVVAPVLQDDPRLEPDRRQSSEELGTLLRRAIARLSPRAAEMFALRYFEGYDNPEIARMCETTAANVAVTLHRTRTELQAAMHSYRETRHE
ncbi:MAG TPA: RNA polymerase sigma factor [Bryobacteraceae bacterium]|nr:RNA polymerase sigma factor [Bryobacteraceae bacterium]